MREPKTLVLLIITALVATGTGMVLDRMLMSGGDATPATDEEEPLYWVAPMDSNYRRDEPGQSPMGMDLVPVYADDLAGGGDEGGVRVSATVQNNLGLRTAAAEEGELPRIVETVGYVRYDEDRIQHVHTRVEGWVQGLQASAVGDPVEAGQTLFSLYAPKLVSAQEEYLTARRSGSESLLAASRARLETLGMSSRQIRRLAESGQPTARMEVTAEQDGVIAALGVREGQFITPGTHALEVADLSEVWLVAEVFERQADWVSEGQAARIRFESYPGKTWDGVVDYVYPALDADTRTLQVRVRLENEERRLRPNMYGRVRIQGRPTAMTVHVPREAVIRGGRADRVVLASGDGRFRAVPVTVGIEAGDRIQILDGLAAGDEVVVSGQFLIDSESSLDAEIGRAGESEMEGEADHHHHGHDMGDDS